MTEVNELEEHKNINQKLMHRRDLVKRLETNPDFVELIYDIFCTEECARYVQVSTDPHLGEEDRQNAMEMARAAGHLKRFLEITVRLGDTAENQMDELSALINSTRGILIWIRILKIYLMRKFLP